MKSTPGREGQRNEPHVGGYGSTHDANPDRSRSREGRSAEAAGPVKEKKKGKMSMWKMMALTVSMGGSQVSPPKTMARISTDAL